MFKRPSNGEISLFLHQQRVAATTFPFEGFFCLNEHVDKLYATLQLCINIRNLYKYQNKYHQLRSFSYIQFVCVRLSAIREWSIICHSIDYVLAAKTTAQ